MAFLRRHLHKAWQLLRSPVEELSLAIVEDAEMARLHDQFLGDPTTTDVLTFPLRQNEAGDVIEGELIICCDEAERCAAARGLPVQHELLLYALHGLLHLSGYDDTSQASFRKMHAKEDELLVKLKIGKVFAAREVAQGDRQ